MMLFMGFAFYSFLTNLDQHVEIDLGSPMTAYASAILLFFVTLTVIDSVRRLYWSLMVATGTVAFASLYLIREWRSGVGMYGSGYRPGWVLGDANYFTVAALAILPVSFELLLLAKSRWQKLYCLGCIALTVFTITIGASRGGFLGIVVEIIYLVVRSGISKKKLIRLLVIAMFFLLLAPNSPIHRFLSPVPGDDQSVDKHILGWMAGLNMVKAHPLVGVGLGNFKGVVASYDTTGMVAADPKIAHNAFLEIAAEMGVFALLVYLLFLGTIFRSLETTRRRALATDSQALAALALGMQASLLGVSVAIFFVSGQYTRMLWLIFIMTMAMPALVPKRKAERKKPSRQDERVEEPALQVGSVLVEMQ
jgi:O-antigen ligase